MKKILFAMAVLAALASCQKADLAEQNSVNTNGERVITAYFDNAQTKTTLDGVTPKWTEGDKIMLLDGSGKLEITLDADDISSDGKSVTITVTDLSGTLYAVYPSDATDAERIVTEDSVPVTLKADQDGTFGSANICVAKENDGSLAFKNVTSVLHLTQVAATTNVNEIIITTPSAYIAGTGTVDMSETTPTLALSSGQSKIKVKSASPQSDYYIAVAPTTLPEGTAFGFATGSQLGGTNLSEGKTIEVNTIYDIGSMDESELGSNKYHEYVEIGGLKWATMNVGANSKTDAGRYFAWGYAEGCVRNTAGDGWVLASDNTTEMQFNSTYFEDRNASSFQDAATANWGGSWRMPTNDEFSELVGNYYWAWKDNEGCYMFDSGSGYAAGGKSSSIPTGLNTSSALLFFPTAGTGNGNSLDNPQKICSFQSSTDGTVSGKAKLLIISMTTGSLIVTTNQSYKNYGFSVRPVSD